MLHQQAQQTGILLRPVGNEVAEIQMIMDGQFKPPEPKPANVPCIAFQGKQRHRSLAAEKYIKRQRGRIGLERFKITLVPEVEMEKTLCCQRVNNPGPQFPQGGKTLTAAINSHGRTVCVLTKCYSLDISHYDSGFF